MKSFELRRKFSCSPEHLFDLWVKPILQSNYTSAITTGEPIIGGTFTAYDDYISGTFLALLKGSYIKQGWRTTEFEEDDLDSELEILISETSEGSELILKHTRIPENQSDYEKGWIEFYFEPLEEYLRQEN